MRVNYENRVKGIKRTCRRLSVNPECRRPGGLWGAEPPVQEARGLRGAEPPVQEVKEGLWRAEPPVELPA